MELSEEEIREKVQEAAQEVADNNQTDMHSLRLIEETGEKALDKLLSTENSGEGGA